MEKIRIGIAGHGNIGRGVELAVERNEDMELKAVFTRRAPETVEIMTEGVPVVHMDELPHWKKDIDVIVLCGGSATDLPVIGPEIVENFNTVDSFDTHAKIPEYFANIDTAAKKGGNRTGGYLYLLGQGCESGTFRCNPSGSGREKRHSVHSSG